MALRDIIRKSVGFKENALPVADPRQVKNTVHVAEQPFVTKQHYARIPSLATTIARSVGLKPKSRDPRQDDCESIVGKDACDVLADKDAGRLTHRTNGALVIKSAVESAAKHFNQSLASGKVTASTSLQSAVDQRLKGMVVRAGHSLPGWRIDGAGYGEKNVSGLDAFVIPEGAQFRLVLVDAAGDMLVPVDNEPAIFDTMIGAQEVGERFLNGDDAGAFIEINAAIAELEAASITRSARPKRLSANDWRKLINRSDRIKRPQNGLIVRAVAGSVHSDTGKTRGAFSVRSAVLKTLGITHERQQPQKVGLSVRSAMRAQGNDISVERTATPQGFGFRCPTSGQAWINREAWLASSTYSLKRNE